MKKVLISSFDMEIGGVERSLVNMLENFDYENYSIDLLLYKQQGEFMNLVPKSVNLLNEISEYTTFRMSIKEIFKNGKFFIGTTRIFSKLNAMYKCKIKKIAEPGYLQMQLMWKFALPFLPKLENEYDVAISYLWPHYFVGTKVKAKKKIAWIHTDYSIIQTDIKQDLKMWNQFDRIIAVSDACKDSFLYKYKSLENKVIVIENIISPDFIKMMSIEDVENPMKLDNRFKILTVSRLSYAKGIDQAVKALKLLRNKGYKNLVWYVVGYGGDELNIKKIISELGLQESFVLLGKRTNPYPFIKEANLYVQPSRYEGKAVTVTEAKILGKPILITNYSTAKSQVMDQLDGIITELSIEGIANGIERLYLDHKLREELVNNCEVADYSNKHELERLFMELVL